MDKSLSKAEVGHKAEEKTNPIGDENNRKQERTSGDEELRENQPGPSSRLRNVTLDMNICQPKMDNSLTNEEADHDAEGATNTIGEENREQESTEGDEELGENQPGPSSRLQNLTLDMNRCQPGYQQFETSGVWKVFQKLRRLTGSKEINLADIFGSLDPRGTGRLPYKAFVSALMGTIGYHAALSWTDIELITHFCLDRSTNSIDYRSFMDFVEEPTPRAYEPVLIPPSPILEPRRHSTAADTAEIGALYNVMDYIASVLIYKKVHLDAYLRENESLMKKQHVTIPQLKKVFIHMGILLDDEHFNLICKWFARNAFLVDTSLFVSQIDDAIERVVTSGSYDAEKISKNIGRRFKSTFPKKTLADMRACDTREFFRHYGSAHNCQNRWANMTEEVTDLVIRLQRGIHVNKIIPRPRFHQFDRLNTGKITVNEFRRALDQCGINTSTYSSIYISPKEFDALAELYSEGCEPGYVMWRAFVCDIESGVCIRDLHRRPSADISDHELHGPRKEVLNLPCKYARRKNMTREEHRRTERVMEYVKHQLHDCDLYQFFQSFDKKSRGHVTRNQFREIMRMSNVILREQDVYDLEQYFIDYSGFCYKFFLQVMGTGLPPPPATESNKDPPVFRKYGLITEKGYAPYEAEGRTGQEVLQKIKDTVFQRNLRLKYWFETFDKFNSGVMNDATFVRALSGAHNWAFTNAEYKKLIELFRRPLTDNVVEYQQFLNAIDEMYTQPDLERSPLINPVPNLGWKERAKYTDEQFDILGKALNKIVQHGICMDHLSTFKDMDLQKCSTIPRHRFLQALDFLGVLKYLSERDQSLIFNAFSRPVFHRMEFDYTRFLKACNHVCRKSFADDD